MSYMRDRSGRRLDSFEVAANRKPTIVWLGDSITENGGGTPPSATNAVHYNANGFWTWGQAFLGWPFETLRNAGVAGQRSDQVLARVATDVVALAPDWCHVLVGTNDIGQAVTVSTIKANITAILDALSAAGIRTIIGTIPPRNAYTGTQAADTYTLNAWIRGLSRSRRGMIVVDYYSVVVSPQLNTWATSGEAGQALTPDGIHPGNGAAPRMGKEFARVLAAVIPPAPRIPGTEADLGNILLYSRGVAGTVGSAAPPTGWVEANLSGGPVVYSRVARAPGGIVGSNWQAAIPAGGTVTLRNGNIRASSWSVGDTVVGDMELTRASIDQVAALGTVGARLAVNANGGGKVIQCFPWSAGQDNMPLWDQTLTLRTPSLVIPVGTTTLTLELLLSGGGTYTIGRSDIINLTRTPEYA